jgi:hypothetical protein
MAGKSNSTSASKSVLQNAKRKAEEVQASQAKNKKKCSQPQMGDASTHNSLNIQHSNSSADDQFKQMKEALEANFGKLLKRLDAVEAKMDQMEKKIETTSSTPSDSDKLATFSVRKSELLLKLIN